MGKKPRPTNKPTTIFYMRHGNTDNPQHLIKGVASFPLSQKGREKVRKQAEILRDKKIAVIFTSPILRCRQTAEIVAGVLNKSLIRHLRDEHILTPPGCQAKEGEILGPKGVKVKVATHLTEWTSSLDGQPLEQARRLPAEKYNRAFEPRPKVVKRMMDFVQMALKKYVGQKVVAVSHQGPIDLLLLSLHGKDVSQAPYKGLLTRQAEIVKLVLSPEMEPIELERFPPEE